VIELNYVEGLAKGIEADEICSFMIDTLLLSMGKIR